MAEIIRPPQFDSGLGRARTGGDKTGGGDGTKGGEPPVSGPTDEHVTRRELELSLIAVVETLRGDIRELKGISLHRWEFWFAMLAIILSLVLGMWSASQTAAQNGITLNQGMNDAANRAAEQARDDMLRELDRRDAEKSRR
jgi:hypothetical protein